MGKRNERCNGCDELKRELKKAKRLLVTIAAHAETTATPAATELGHGNVPQRRYEYLKAQVEVCNEILTLLGLPLVEIKQRLAIKGLFSGFLSGK